MNFQSIYANVVTTTPLKLCCLLLFIYLFLPICVSDHLFLTRLCWMYESSDQALNFSVFQLYIS